MKKSICIAICTILTAGAICLGAVPVFGNSAPSYWKSHPYSEVLAVEEDSPITVDREHLIFDFSGAGDDDGSRGMMSPVGRVIAEYQMTNPSDDTLTVQMAFPFAANLYNLSVTDITVRADGDAVPYDIYIDPDGIDLSIGNISNQEWTLPGFDLDSEAKLFRFALSSRENPYLEFVISFDTDREQTFLIGKDFHAVSYSEEEGGELSVRFRGQDEPEILVLGKAPEFTYEVWTDAGVKAEEDRYQLEITEESVDQKAYLLAALRGEIEDTAAAVSDTQLFNLLLRALWQGRQENGYASLAEAFSTFHRDRTFTLVYAVEFPAGSTKTVRVGYLTEGTMDARETLSPKYSYTYLLSPAKNWAAFGSLDVDIIPPREAPYIIESSLALTRDQENRYRAHFEELPESELTFTLFEKEKVTMIDKAKKSVYEMRYFLYFLRPVVFLILIAAAVAAVRSLLRARRAREK